MGLLSRCILDKPAPGCPTYVDRAVRLMDVLESGTVPELSPEERLLVDRLQDASVGLNEQELARLERLLLPAQR